MLGPACPIVVVRKKTTTNKLTIAQNGRIELKLTEQMDQAGEEWLKNFARMIVTDVMETLPMERTLRGRFRRREGTQYVIIELHAGSYHAKEVLKCYVSEKLGLLEPPASI